MITFFPERLPMWDDAFDFAPPITLAPKCKTDHKVFHNRYELIDFMKQYGVVTTDASAPLTIVDDYSKRIHNHTGLQMVYQGQCLGWIKDDYR